MKKYRYLVVSNVELTVNSSPQDIPKVYPRNNTFPEYEYSGVVSPDFNIQRTKDWMGREIVIQLQPDEEDLKLS